MLAVERTIDAWQRGSRFRSGLRRLYAQNERFGAWLESKVARVGDGPFGAIVYCDHAPVYELRRTSDGDMMVNSRAWDAKQRYVVRWFANPFLSESPLRAFCTLRIGTVR